MKKKVLTAFLSLALVHSMAIPAYAAADLAATDAQQTTPTPPNTSSIYDSHQYTIQVNGKDLSSEACVVVPLRAVAEALGFAVTWSKNGILVDNGIVHTTVTIGVDRYQITTSKENLVGMSSPFSLGTAPYIANGVTYVPLGLFNVLLGNKDDVVSLDGDKVIIKTENT